MMSSNCEASMILKDENWNYTVENGHEIVIKDINDLIRIINR